MSGMDLQTMISYIKNPEVFKNASRSLAIAKNQFRGALFTKLCHDAGVFRYGYFVLEKR